MSKGVLVSLEPVKLPVDDKDQLSQPRPREPSAIHRIVENNKYCFKPIDAALLHIKRYIYYWNEEITRLSGLCLYNQESW